jgi:hypothetical protein
MTTTQNERRIPRVLSFFSATAFYTASMALALGAALAGKQESDGVFFGSGKAN